MASQIATMETATANADGRPEAREVALARRTKVAFDRVGRMEGGVGALS